MSPELQYAVARASELPYQSGRSRHYAVLLDKRGKVVTEGSNSYDKTHPVFQRMATTVGLGVKTYQHAEFVVIHRDRNQKGYRLVVARVDSVGNPVNSMPCAVCMKLIRVNENIKMVEWT